MFTSNDWDGERKRISANVLIIKKSKCLCQRSPRQFTIPTADKNQPPRSCFKSRRRPTLTGDFSVFALSWNILMQEEEEGKERKLFRLRFLLRRKDGEEREREERRWLRNYNHSRNKTVEVKRAELHSHFTLSSSCLPHTALLFLLSSVFHFPVYFLFLPRCHLSVCPSIYPC